jgi:hypothetical protein
MLEWELKATDWGSFPRSALQLFRCQIIALPMGDRGLGLINPPIGVHFGWASIATNSFKPTICCSALEKGVANPEFRAHSHSKVKDIEVFGVFPPTAIRRKAFSTL